MASPAASVPLALPWISGEPASLFWRVRALGPEGVLAVERARRVQHALDATQPKPLKSGPGYIRWSTVDGATGYQVWFLNANDSSLGKVISTITNVADEREYYVSDTVPSTGRLLARPRRAQACTAARRTACRPSRTARGATSSSRRTRRPRASIRRRRGRVDEGHRNPLDDKYARLRPLTAVSDVVSTAGHPKPHCAHAGDHGGRQPDDAREPLPRLHVHRPRLRQQGVHRLPGHEPGLRAALDRRRRARGRHAADGRRHARQRRPSAAQLRADAAGRCDGGCTIGAAPPRLRRRRRRTQARPRSTSGTRAAATSWSPSRSSRSCHHGSRDGPTGPTIRPVPTGTTGATGASGTTGATTAAAAGTEARPTPSAASAIAYQDLELPQDICSKGRFITFGKASRTPQLTSGGTPTAVGLSPNGRLLSAVHSKPAFYGSPLVTWEPASGAIGYQVAVEQERVPVEAGRLDQDAGDLRDAPAEAGHVVVPRARHQRLAARQPAHELVGSGARSSSPARPSGCCVASRVRMRTASRPGRPRRGRDRPRARPPSRARRSGSTRTPAIANSIAARHGAPYSLVGLDRANGAKAVPALRAAGGVELSHRLGIWRLPSSRAIGVIPGCAGRACCGPSSPTAS